MLQAGVFEAQKPIQSCQQLKIGNRSFLHYFCGKFLGQQLLDTQGKEKSLFPSVDLFSSHGQVPVTLPKAPWSCQTYSKDGLGIRVIV